MLPQLRTVPYACILPLDYRRSFDSQAIPATEGHAAAPMTDDLSRLAGISTCTSSFALFALDLWSQSPMQHLSTVRAFGLIIAAIRVCLRLH